MNRTQLIEAIADQSGVAKKDVEKVIVTAFEHVIPDTVLGGDDVTLSNFGTFRAIDIPEHEARNPQTGGTVTIEAYRSFRFRTSPQLKAYARGERDSLKKPGSNR